MIDAAGTTTRYEYDARGRLVAETDPAGQKTRLEYDPAGRLSRTIFADGSAESLRYDAAGNLVATVDQQDRTMQLEYDALGRLVRERNAAALEVTYRYDAAGNVLARQDTLGPGATLQRDSAGRIVEVKLPTGAAVRYRYDDIGRLVAVTDALGHVRQLSYDATGVLAEVREADGTVARYGYDLAGRLAVVRHPNGGETRFGYDALGNPLRETNPLGQEVRGTYDRAGQLVAVTRPDGQTIAYTYDAHGLPLEKRLPNGTRVTYQYDNRGNLLKVDDGAFPVVYTRDASGRVTRLEYPALKRSLQYEYTKAGLLSRMIDSEGRSTQYEYDGAGRLAAIGLLPGQRIAFQHDARGRITAIQYPNGVTGRSAYDADGHLASLSYTDTTGKIVAGWRYRYDAAGNRVETVEENGRVTRYRYDPVGQLLEETATGDEVMRYSYQPGGNRARREVAGRSVQYRFDAADRLLQAGSDAFAYDVNGNLVERRGPVGVTRYQYDSENRLIKVTRPDGAEVSYGYAPTGERVWRRDASGITYFVTDGVNVLAELDANLNAKATYVHGPEIDAPLMMERDSRRYYYHTDRLGSIAVLTGDQAQVAASYDYDAFGNVRKSSASVPNPFTYTARELDPATGLYYYRARYYDPDVGRFLSVDPVAPSLGQPFELNPYAYVRNNPMVFTDPLGLYETPGQQLAVALSSLENGKTNLAWARGVPGGAGALEPGYLAQIANAEAKIAELTAQHPGLTPELPKGWGPPEPPQTGGPGRVRAGGGATPGQPPPGVTQDVNVPGSRGGPTQAVPRGDVPAGAKPGSTDTRAIRPGPPPSTGSGISWGRVGAGVIAAATSLAEIAACMNEPDKTASDCAKEAGMIVVGAAAGAVLLATPAAAAAMAAAPVTVGVIAVTLTAAGVYHAGNRLVNAANAPATLAEAAREAELNARMKLLYPKLRATLEAKVAAFEQKAVTSPAGDAGDAAARASAFAAAAASNLAALRGDLAQASGFCAIANGLRQELDALAADADTRLTSLDTGLTAANGMVAQCTSKSDATWAKNLYDTGIKMVAEMVVRAQRAERAQGALQEARAAADQALAAAEQRAQMIAGNAEIAAQAATLARDSGRDGVAARRQALGVERAALDTEINAFPNWFPALPEVANDTAGWRGRVAAAYERAGERGADLASANAADLEATRAASRRDEGRALIAEARARIEGCNQAAAAAANNADAVMTAANAAAAGTLGRFSDLPSSAEACIAKLDASPASAARSLVALSVRCPSKAFVGDQVSCTATGIYGDNLAKAEDLTSGSWDVGPVFTSPTPGPVTVRVSRENMSDAVVVVFEPKPSSEPKTPPLYNPFDDPNFMPSAGNKPGNAPGVAAVGQAGTGFIGVPPASTSGSGRSGAGVPQGPYQGDPSGGQPPGAVAGLTTPAPLGIPGQGVGPAMCRDAAGNIASCPPAGLSPGYDPRGGGPGRIPRDPLNPAPGSRPGMTGTQTPASGGTAGGGMTPPTKGAPPTKVAQTPTAPQPPQQQGVRVNCYSACFNGCMANKGGSGYFQGMCAPEGPCYSTRVTPDACSNFCAGYKQDVLLNTGDLQIGVCGGGPSGVGSKPAAPQPTSGATCGPATSCRCAGGAMGHIPCDKSKGACHCGPG
jgi:RHS repeat-associated protein